MGTRGDAVDSRPGRHSVAARVKAVGVSGQQHGLVALDQDHKVIRPGEGWAVLLTGRSWHALQPSLAALLWVRHVPAGCRMHRDTLCMRARLPLQPSCGAMWRVQKRRLSCRSCLGPPSCPPLRVSVAWHGMALAGMAFGGTHFAEGSLHLVGWQRCS